jgi:hypothetical protein
MAFLSWCWREYWCTWVFHCHLIFNLFNALVFPCCTIPYMYVGVWMCVCANKQVLVMFQQASFHLRQRRLGCSTSVIGGDSTSTWKVIQAFHHPLTLDYFIHFESVLLLDVPNYYGAPNWLLFFVLIYISVFLCTLCRRIF